jgi:hypothetical protein
MNPNGEMGADAAKIMLLDHRSRPRHVTLIDLGERCRQPPSVEAKDSTIIHVRCYKLLPLQLPSLGEQHIQSAVRLMVKLNIRKLTAKGQPYGNLASFLRCLVKQGIKLYETIRVSARILRTRLAGQIKGPGFVPLDPEVLLGATQGPFQATWPIGRPGRLRDCDLHSQAIRYSCSGFLNERRGLLGSDPTQPALCGYGLPVPAEAASDRCPWKPSAHRMAIPNRSK